MSDRTSHSDHHKNLGGESPGARETIDRMRRHLVEQGNDPGYAWRVARKCAIRKDRYNERRRQKPPREDR